MYIQGIQKLKGKGFEIVAIVCDGRKGLLQSFKDIPVHMCQFHQKQIVVRYLLTNTDKESFEGALGLWYEKWKDFLKERSVNLLNNKTFYTHKKLRSAYRSLKNNLSWLLLGMII